MFKDHTCERVPQWVGDHGRGAGWREKSVYQKDVENEANRQNRQHFEGDYFLGL
ncbi:MAG: hypothetical protein WA854_02195 [Candidatus Binataceae bacterium]